MSKPLPTMPAYTRIKRVEAARITGWAQQAHASRFMLTLEGGFEVYVTGRFMRRHMVRIGDYLLKDEEGALSVLTAEKFAQFYAPESKALPELESLPSMQPQAQIVRQEFEVPLKPRPVIPTREALDMVLRRTKQEDGE